MSTQMTWQSEHHHHPVKGKFDRHSGEKQNESTHLYLWPIAAASPCLRASGLRPLGRRLFASADYLVKVEWCAATLEHPPSHLCRAHTNQNGPDSRACSGWKHHHHHHHHRRRHRRRHRRFRRRRHRRHHRCCSCHHHHRRCPRHHRRSRQHRRSRAAHLGRPSRGLSRDRASLEASSAARAARACTSSVVSQRATCVFVLAMRTALHGPGSSPRRAETLLSRVAQEVPDVRVKRLLAMLFRFVHRKPRSRNEKQL